MFVNDSAVLEYRLEREISVKLQLYLVKTEGWVVWACENLASVTNKVDTSTGFLL